MAKSPSEQSRTDRERIPEEGSGKLDRDADRERKKDRARSAVAPSGTPHEYAGPGDAQDLAHKSDTEEHHD